MAEVPTPLSVHTIRNRRHAIVAFGAVIVLAVIWGVAYNLVSKARQRTLEDATTQVADLATLFSDHATSAFRYADDYVKTVRRIYQRERSIDAVRRYMADVPPNSAILSYITLMGADGVLRLIASGVSESKIRTGTNACDRRYFKFQ